MSISASTAAFVNSATPSTSSSSTRPIRQERGEQDGEQRRVGGERGRAQFANAVSSALSALGLSLPTQAAPASSGTTPATAAAESSQSVDNNAASKSDVQQALQGFMHSLFQALKSQGEGRRSEGNREGERENEGSSREIRSGRDNYRNDLAARVQNLVQNLTAETTSSSRIDTLKSSFTDLVQTLQQGKATETTAPAKAPDLQTFLQNFLKNLQGGSTPVSPLGGTVNTVV